MADEKKGGTGERKRRRWSKGAVKSSVQSLQSKAGGGGRVFKQKRVYMNSHMISISKIIILV